MAVNEPFFRIDLPLAPSANHLHTVVRGRKMLSGEGRNYQATVARSIRERFDQLEVPDKNDLCFAAIFFIPKSSFYRRDLDNFLKGTLDAIFGTFKAMGWGGNDCRVTQLHAVKQLAEAGDLEGFCMVSLSLANDSEEM